uniref:BTB domain-containing protein n=1 Tax=Elaeophora elaphi TaxID=1147741 RepID=A0A0R3RKD0_9BILA
MSLITTPFSNLGVDLAAQYRLGYAENELPFRRIYPNFATDYMKESDMLVIFTHCYYLKIRKDVVTTEAGRSLFATVHGVRYIEWTLHVRKKEKEFMVELVRQTDANIKGEFRVQFRAQSKNSRRIECFPARWQELKHRVEFVPHYTETLTKLYQNDEFNPGQLKIEIKLAFALNDFDYIVPEIDLKPLLRLEPYGRDDERLNALQFIQKINQLYIHDYMDRNPLKNKIRLEFESITVKQVLSFAFTGICQIKYYGGSFSSSDFLNYQQFLACLNLLRPLMYQELLQMHDDNFCRLFQKICKAARPPCEINTLQFLRLAIRFGFPKLEACTIARLVAEFPDTYSLHLNVDEEPHIVDEMIQARFEYEMYIKYDDWVDWTVPQLSPLERIELLKAKCKQVHKWIGQGLKTDIPEPEIPPPAPEENLFEVSPILRHFFTYDAMEELD